MATYVGQETDIKDGRLSIAPEKLLRAMLLQVLYSVRSERQLMEQTRYNLLYRWFIGLAMDDVVWVPTVFSKNRERLIAHDAVIELYNHVLATAEKYDWLSGEHFSVHDTLIQAWAGHKSFVPKDDEDNNSEAATSRARSAATIRMHPGPTRMRACTARATMPAACVTWDMRSLTIAMGWLPMRG